MVSARLGQMVSRLAELVTTISESESIRKSAADSVILTYLGGGTSEFAHIHLVVARFRSLRFAPSIHMSFHCFMFMCVETGNGLWP
jgi:hypothetical protein